MGDSESTRGGLDSNGKRLVGDFAIIKVYTGLKFLGEFRANGSSTTTDIYNEYFAKMYQMSTPRASPRWNIPKTRIELNHESNNWELFEFTTTGSKLVIYKSELQSDW